MLYRNENVVIQWKGEESGAKIMNGVRQGCSLSPMLFNVYVEDALMEVRRRMEVGISIQGEMIDMLRFADDIAVLTESREELENFLNVMEEVMRVDYEMKLNKRKTKVMVAGYDIRGQTRIFLGGEQLEEVEEFCYLGSIIRRGGGVLLFGEYNKKRWRV